MFSVYVYTWGIELILVATLSCETEYDSIYTSIKTFKTSSSKWRQIIELCGVTRVCTKKQELQSLYPAIFENIFLGLGGLHMEKNILACCCTQYVKFIGARVIFGHNEIFGQNVTNNVMTGNDYKLWCQTTRILSKSVVRLRLQIFFNDNKADLQKMVETLGWRKWRNGRKNGRKCPKCRWKEEEW